ncbi:MAG: tyrosine-protein phosphatase [Proteobacteria bacterium]|nr:tyrosine-protein phosphatase [Pseudomonadota bacterium]
MLLLKYDLSLVLLQNQQNKMLWTDHISKLPLTKGNIIMMPKPPKGDHLGHFTAFLKQQGVNQVVSLLEPLESQQFGLVSHAMLCEGEDIEHHNFPIKDHGIPLDVQKFLGLIEQLANALDQGQTIAFHCFAGIGRTGLTAASVMIHLGHDLDVALIQLSKARGLRVPETLQQVQFLHHINHSILASTNDPFFL